LGTLFTWGMTALGAALVFTTKTMNQKLFDGILGFAGGVMIAASFWSLLSPASSMAENGSLPAWLPASLGFLLGGAFLWGVDKIIPHLHPNSPMENAEGIRPANKRRSTLLVLAITLHNIPEGAAVSMPLRREGMSRRKSFLYGQFSGMVEPIAAVIGVMAVTLMEPLLPFALSFAAGAMIFVVAEEVIPGSQENGNKDFASMCLMIGFTIMMILDVALG
jgi:ZIP family zinc transporter